MAHTSDESSNDQYASAFDERALLPSERDKVVAPHATPQLGTRTGSSVSGSDERPHATFESTSTEMENISNSE